MALTRFLDPKNDIVFRKIFGNHPPLIKSFLNAVLPLPEGGLIEEIEYLNADQAPSIPTMKNTIVDVKCRDQKGRIFIVEMQMQWSDSFTKRLTFGASKAYVQQLGRGEHYKSLCPVYGLGIIDAIFDRKTDEWYHHYKTINVKDHEKVLEGLELVFIELPKFTPKSVMERKLGVLWLRFLKELETLRQMPQEFQEIPELAEASELSQESAYTPGELEAYNKYLDAVRVERTFIADALAKGEQKGLEKGLEKGEQIGLEKGLEKGEQIGLEKGLEKTARAMKAKGLPSSVIAECTGLSIQQIEEF